MAFPGRGCMGNRWRVAGGFRKRGGAVPGFGRWSAEGGGVVAQGVPEPLCLPARHLVHQGPEARAVVHFPCVAKFVEQHVVRQLARQDHKVERKVDVPPAGTTAPTGACRIDSHAAVAESVAAGQFVQAGREDGLGLFAQGFRDDFEEPGLQGVEGGLRGIDDVHAVRLVADEELLLPSFGEAEGQLVCFYLEILVDHWDGFCRALSSLAFGAGLDVVVR